MDSKNLHSQVVGPSQTPYMVNVLCKGDRYGMLVWQIFRTCPEVAALRPQRQAYCLGKHHGYATLKFALRTMT
jgi:hypothetical protein